MPDDFFSFSQEIQKKIPQLCLIISQQKEAVNFIIRRWQGRLRTFEGENFLASDFYNEIENYSLFGEPLLYHLRDVDKLRENDRKKLVSYLQNPNKAVSLLLSSSFVTLVSEVKQNGGIVFQLLEEKSWQKRQRLERLLSEHAKNQEIIFSGEALKQLIDRVGPDKDILFQEFEKLVTFTFPKKFISAEDVIELTHKDDFSTPWDLGEAIFGKKFSLSLEKAKAMLDEGVSLFSLLAQLRTQFKTLYSMTSLFEKGGQSLLLEEYPYLKGNILSKKINEIKNNPLKKLKKGLFFIFEAELQAKSLIQDPLATLEVLLLKLMHL